jgi:SDR family mycofactocin-dependent oxidoreductase
MTSSAQPLDGQVALVTGAARGQGRAHAEGLARDGASVVICDIGEDIETVPYSLGRKDELEETAELVRSHGRRCLPMVCDVRSASDVELLVTAALEDFGRLDILVANAGIVSFGRLETLSDQAWNDVIATNLTGVFYAMRAVVPHMRSRGYGRIIATASMAGRGGTVNAGHYVASKWGVIGLVKSLAREVAADGITVNAICTTHVDTAIVHSSAMYEQLRPDLAGPTRADVLPALTAAHQIPVPLVSPEDVALVSRYLALPSTRFVTGSTLDVALGNTALMP